jgi:hypothetical protein
MAQLIKYSATLRNAQLDAVTTAIGASGKLRIYSGTRPANVAAAITGTLLAELTLNATFAPAASGGVLTANAITGDASADSTGTATHFRIWKSDGTTAVIDGEVGTSGADLNLTSVSIVATEPVNVTSLVITRGNA